MKPAMKKSVFRVVAAAAILSFGIACDHGASPEANASKSEETSANVKTPADGGSATTNKRSVSERPVPPENLRMGSAVPPAAADQTRPHPQQQQQTPAQSTPQPGREPGAP
jgi:hypothetical protein